MSRIIYAAALALTVTAPAMAQEADAAAGAQAIAIVGGGGSEGTQRAEIKSHPDVVAPSGFPSPQTCRYSEGVGLGALWFGGAGASRGSLDEGCEARADSAHYAELARYRIELFGDEGGALRNLEIAERRMLSTREQFVSDGWAALSTPWPELWRP